MYPGRALKRPQGLAGVVQGIGLGCAHQQSRSLRVNLNNLTPEGAPPPPNYRELSLDPIIFLSNESRAKLERALAAGRGRDDSRENHMHTGRVRTGRKQCREEMLLAEVSK